jgi:hypothetical protein
MIVLIPCSPEQAEVVADHLLQGQELGILPDERAWMIAYVAKHHGGRKILGAELLLGDAEWRVMLGDL